MKGSSRQDTLQRARNYAFLLLKFSPRSVQEISKRLEKKGFPHEVIKETVAFLKEKSFLDDNYFTRAWIEARLKKPLSLRRIKQELRLKGIEREIIDSNISSIKESYCEEEIVKEIAKTKLARLKNLKPAKAKRRIYAYLFGRGFSPEIIMDTLRIL